MTVLAVLTAPRPGGASYVQQTIDQVNANGGALAAERLLWSDGPLPAGLRGLGGWRVVRADRQGPPNSAAFADLLEHGVPRGADVLFLEDDLHLCRNAVEYMLARPLPAPARYVAWCDTEIAAPARRLYFAPTAQQHQLQAVTFPAAAVEAIVAHRRTAGWLPARGSDSNLARAFPPGSLYAIHVPSLVQHVGIVTAAGEVGSLVGRVSRSWRGAAFDARLLDPATCNLAVKHHGSV